MALPSILSFNESWPHDLNIYLASVPHSYHIVYVHGASPGDIDSFMTNYTRAHPDSTNVIFEEGDSDIIRRTKVLESFSTPCLGNAPVIFDRYKKSSPSFPSWRFLIELKACNAYINTRHYPFRDRIPIKPCHIVIFCDLPSIRGFSSLPHSRILDVEVETSALRYKLSHPWKWEPSLRVYAKMSTSARKFDNLTKKARISDAIDASDLDKVDPFGLDYRRP